MAGYTTNPGLADALAGFQKSLFPDPSKQLKAANMRAQADYYNQRRLSQIAEDQRKQAEADREAAAAAAVAQHGKSLGEILAVRPGDVQAVVEAPRPSPGFVGPMPSENDLWTPPEINSRINQILGEGSRYKDFNASALQALTGRQALEAPDWRSGMSAFNGASGDNLNSVAQDAGIATTKYDREQEAARLKSGRDHANAKDLETHTRGLTPIAPDMIIPGPLSRTAEVTQDRATSISNNISARNNREKMAATRDELLAKGYTVGEKDTRVLDPKTQQLLGLPDNVMRGAGVSTGGEDGPEPNAVLTEGPFEGTGDNQQSKNVIYNVMRKVGSGNGSSLSPENVLLYSQAFDSLYGPKQREVPYVAADGSEGRQIVTVTPKIPPGLIRPDQLAEQLGIRLPAFTGTPTPPASATPSLDAAAPMPGAAPAAPSVSEVAPSASETPPNVIRGTLKPPKTKPPGEAQTKMARFAGSTDEAAGNLFAVFGYDPATGELAEDGWRPGWGQRLAEVTPRAGLFGPSDVADEKTQMYRQASMDALTPIMRLDSGAAIPMTEYPMYKERFIPIPGDTNGTVSVKLRALAREVQIMNAFARASKYDINALEDMSPEAQNRISDEWKIFKNRVENGLETVGALEQAPAPVTGTNPQLIDMLRGLGVGGPQ
jgi:hypothetical protein